MAPQPGEQVFFHGHPSWRSMVGFHLKGLIGSVIVGVVTGLLTIHEPGHVEVGWVMVAVLLGFAVVLATGALKRLRTTYTITSQRLTIDIGLLSREVHETRLERVQNVNSRQSVLERILGVGIVDFDTAGSAEYDFTFRGVARPREIVRTVDRALHALQHAGRGFDPAESA